MVITYTRPSLPSLRFESLSPPPAEALWPDSDEDAGVDIHITKKRRIESLGQQYLRGRPLFILSAGLRGPLHDGWLNPWTKREKTGRVGGGRESVEAVTARKVATALSKSAYNDSPHRETLATAVTQTSARDQEEDHVAATDHDTLVHKEHALVEKLERLVQADDKGAGFGKDKVLTTLPRESDLAEAPAKHPADDNGASCTSSRKDKVLTTLPRGADLAEALAMNPADDPRPKETNWLKSNATILRSGSRATSKSPTPTPVSRPSDNSSLGLQVPARCGVDTSTTASKVEAKEPQPSAFPSLSGFTPINVRRPMGFDRVSASNPNLETPTRLAKGGRHKKETSIDQPPAVTETTLLQADIETREGFLSAKRLSQEAIRHAELQDGYLAVKKLSHEAAKRALDSSPTPVPGLSTERKFPPTYYAGTVVPSAGKPANSERRASNNLRHRKSSADSQPLSNIVAKDRHPTNPKSVLSPAHALPASTSPAGFLYRRTTSGSSSSSLDSTPYPQALEAAKAQAVKRLSFTASGNVKFGSPSPPNSQRSNAESIKQASPLRQKPLNQLFLGKANSTSNSSNFSATDMLPPKDISDASRVLPDAQGLSRQAGIIEAVQSVPSTNLLETDKQSVKFPSTEEGDSDSHFSTQAAVIKAQRSFQTALVSPLKDQSMPSATLRQMHVLGPVGSGLNADNTKAAIKPFRTFHDICAEHPEKMYTPALDELPMSTQAMIDAATPFTRSTIRKPAPKKRASFMPSPTEGKGLGSEDGIDGGFGKLGLDMETSPDISENEGKPYSNTPSALRSLSKQSSSIHLQLSPAFSIAPNGTLTEVYQQDGQRPAAEWDLNAVIDDAGSFLGSWDVDNELKRDKVASYGKAISEEGSKR